MLVNGGMINETAGHVEKENLTTTYSLLVIHECWIYETSKIGTKNFFTNAVFTAERVEVTNS